MFTDVIGTELNSDGKILFEKQPIFERIDD